jgi:alpha-galactosidase
MIKKSSQCLRVILVLLVCQYSLATAKSFTEKERRPPSSRQAKGIVTIKYGSNSKIGYDLTTGRLNVYVNNQAVFTNIYCAVKYNRDSVSSGSYTERKYSTHQIADGFGRGQVHIITLTGKGLPQMRQLFYTYTGRQFFLTETELEGEKLQSNFMAPFIGDFIKMNGDIRTVFFPFDNDTFISYDAKAFSPGKTNVSSEIGVVYNDKSRVGIVAGSVEHGLWKTGIRIASAAPGGNSIRVWGGYTEEAVTRDNMPHGMVKGNHLKSPKILIGYFQDWRNGLEEYGKANRIADPPYVFNWTKPTPVGWNSWGVMQNKLTYDKAIKVADFFADSLKSFRTGNTAYIDLDAYWDFVAKGGDYSPLKHFVDYCKSKGLQPGVYWAPFTDWGHKGGPDRKVEGSDYKFGELWTKVGNGYHDIDGARALDPTHPGTRQRIAYFISKLKACGFKMIKIDFLGHGAAESTRFYDTTVTTGMQAYRKGMEYLIDQLGDQLFIYAAISPSLATGRYVHSRRIACDAFKTIEHTKYTLNSVTYGWWQTYLYNFIDADHVVLDHQTEGENRARMLSSAITGTFITGDDFSTNGPWSAHAKEWYQDPEFLKIIQNGKAFMPVEGDKDKGASSMFVRKIGDSFYLAVFNYNSKARSLLIDARRLGLNPEHSYKGTELFHHNEVMLRNTLNVELPAADAMIIKLKID